MKRKTKAADAASTDTESRRDRETDLEDLAPDEDDQAGVRGGASNVEKTNQDVRTDQINKIRG